MCELSATQELLAEMQSVNSFELQENHSLFMYISQTHTHTEMTKFDELKKLFIPESLLCSSGS